MNAIIIYYSRSGTTEKLALRAARDLHCNTIKIEPEDAYGNYVASLVRVIKERGEQAAPKFATPIPDLSTYDVVLLGYPIWAYGPPVFVSDFIRHCDLNGKTVIPFSTSGGSNISCTLKTLEGVCSGARLLLPFNYGMFKKDDYDQWIGMVCNLE